MASGEPVPSTPVVPYYLRSTSAPEQNFTFNTELLRPGWQPPPATTWFTSTSTPSALSPDLLRLEQIGEADGLRGRIVRAFFRLLEFWPTTRIERS